MPKTLQGEVYVNMAGISIVEIRCYFSYLLQRKNIMKVTYCKQCQKYFYTSQLKNLGCKICSQTLIILPIDFVKFTDMGINERKIFIKKVIH